MRLFVLFASAFSLLIAPPAFAQKAKSRGDSAALLARGKYLVSGVGMCADCHSTRNEKGEISEAQLLQGAVLTFKPTVPMPVWAEKAPKIAGLPEWEKDAAIRFLMTGIAYNELPARPPMPQYRFNQQDAEAIVAYLKSLAPSK